MYYLFIRWRVQKLVKRGDQQRSQSQVLLKTRGVEIDPRRRTTIEDRLE